MPEYVAANPGIRRRWLVIGTALAVAWYVLLFPVATALYGPAGAAPDARAQAARLVYEEAVKIAVLLVPVLVAGWVGARTLGARTFPPPGLRLPARLSVTRGAPAMATGIALLAGALATVLFRALSLRVSLELAALLQRVG